MLPDMAINHATHAADLEAALEMTRRELAQANAMLEVTHEERHRLMARNMRLEAELAQANGHIDRLVQTVQELFGDGKR